MAFYNLKSLKKFYKICSQINSYEVPVITMTLYLNSNRTCPVCTGLPDNSVYWPDSIVQYAALTRLTYDRGQFSWHSPVRGLTMTTPMARSDFLHTVPGLILGLFHRPHWLSPPWWKAMFITGLKLNCTHYAVLRQFECCH